MKNDTKYNNLQIRQTMKRKIFYLTVVTAVFFQFLTVSAQNSEPPFLQYLNHPWVDSVLKSLSAEEKIAQLLWLATYSNRSIDYDVEISNTVKAIMPGGLVFFQGTPQKQVDMINHFRKILKLPPLMATDAEWGAGMRLEGIGKFPYQMTLGAIQNDSLIYLMGAEIAKMLKRTGIDINLAPVADVNNNPANPVINVRSFGEDPGNVSRKAMMYMKGLQDNGIIAVGKHFPGHGDTDVDSHSGLPVIRHNRQRLDSVELLPFKVLINNGISGIMPGHLSVPALNQTDSLPVTLSEAVLTGLLKKELGFSGIAISDAMNMGGITKYSSPGEAEALSLKSGMDVLEYVTDPALSIKIVTENIKNGKQTSAELDEKCRKVLAMKYWAGLSKPETLKKENLMTDLTNPCISAFIRELYANALTVLNNEQYLIPVRNLDKTRIATLAVGRNELTDYQNRISSYTKTDHFFISTFDEKKISETLKSLASYDLVIAGVYAPDRSPANYPASQNLNTFINKLNSQNRCIITWFGNAYLAGQIEAISEVPGLILTYQNNSITEDLSAQLIFGGIGAKGKLPVTINDRYHCGYGIITPGNLRLQYGLPENAGISSFVLIHKIDSIANSGISAGAYPGCEIMIARKGMVIFHKCYGYHTYENKTPVGENDMYDLASVTKISATTPALMLLQTEGLFNPDEKLAGYLPDFRKSNKADLIIREMLAHQAGLTAWIPFWKETVKKNGDFKSRTFSHEQSARYPLKVAQGLYIHKNYRDKIFKEIKKSPVSSEKKYLYSDLSFIIMPEIIDRLSGQKWFELVEDSVYHKIGAFDICFNPYLYYPPERIVPTEYDSLFRKQQLHGTVHDEGAAMLGGISGHAGLFATASDLMKLMELYRRMGNYGGEQLIGEEVMKEYTKVQFPENNNRRGLGFDKPLVDNASRPPKETYPTFGASPGSFGHSGYTGTFVWVDPDYEISYVFLSNRVYPTRNNNKLSDMNIRTEILQAIYDSIIK